MRQDLIEIFGNGVEDGHLVEQTPGRTFGTGSVVTLSSMITPVALEWVIASCKQGRARRRAKRAVGMPLGNIAG